MSSFHYSLSLSLSPPLSLSLSLSPPLSQVHFLYQYSLQFFLDIFQSVLVSNPHLKGVADYFKRLTTITQDLFQVLQ